MVYGGVRRAGANIIGRIGRRPPRSKSVPVPARSSIALNCLERSAAPRVAKGVDDREYLFNYRTINVQTRHEFSMFSYSYTLESIILS